MSDVGIYVHVPFCLTRCGYCDFNAYAGLDHLAPRYVRALLAEAGLAAPAWAEDEVVSIFFGGGTPTTLDVADLKGVLTHVRDRFRGPRRCRGLDRGQPGHGRHRRSSKGCLAAGFDRLSMGAQSFDRGVLEALERLHSPDSVRRAFVAARAAGYENVNLDLIYGADGEGLDSWERTLEQAIDLAPEHISAYALTIEPATALGRKVQTGVGARARPGPAGRHVLGGVRSVARRRLRPLRGLELGEAGLRVPAQPGLLGAPRRTSGSAPGAHSFRDDRRWWNVRPPEEYMARVEAGRAADRRRRAARPVRRLSRGGLPPAADPARHPVVVGRRGAARSRSWRAGCSKRTTARWSPPSAACCC